MIMGRMETAPYRVTLEERPGYLHAVIIGEQDSFDVTMGACTEIAAGAKVRKAKKLLVEHKVKGTLSTLDVFKIASKLPDLFEGVVVAFCVHLTANPDNPQFLEHVATNRGGVGRLFADPRDAVAWLQSL